MFFCGTEMTENYTTVVKGSFLDSMNISQNKHFMATNKRRQESHSGLKLATFIDTE